MTDRMSPEPPQWPAGQLVASETQYDRQIEVWIREIERAPTRLREVVSGLSNDQLDTTYRNWTIRQIVHHLADSHMNGYVRFKLALTEERPTTKSYDENSWSLLADARHADIEPSLQLMEGLHARWAYLLRSLVSDVFERSFHAPGLATYFNIASGKSATNAPSSSQQAAAVSSIPSGKLFDREIVSLWQALAVYAWHAGHHTAQIEWVRKHKLSMPDG